MGGSGSTASSGINGGWAGCPGTTSLTWKAFSGAPTAVTGTGGNAQITASWTAPSDSGTASITGYTVTASPQPSGTPVSQTFNSTATTETLTGLTNGTSYNVSVAAVTSVGTGRRPMRVQQPDGGGTRRRSPRPPRRHSPSGRRAPSR